MVPHSVTQSARKNGHRGDRELLFLGAPANYAAKILTGTDSARVTSEIYYALPEGLQDYFEAVEDDRLGITVYDMRPISTEDLDAFLKTYGMTWDRAASLQRIKDDKANYPLNKIDYSDAEVLIDMDSLGIRNNKRVLAASVFGDVSGFTAYIDKAAAEGDAKAALRVLHAIRKEMASIVKHHFGGVRVQFQPIGCRLFSISRKVMKSVSQFEPLIRLSRCSLRWSLSSKSCCRRRPISGWRSDLQWEQLSSQSWEHTVIATASASEILLRTPQPTRKARPAERSQSRVHPPPPGRRPSEAICME